MDANPSDASTFSANPATSWRRRWRIACLACLCLASIFVTADLLLWAVAPDAVQAPWFMILRGLDALGTLLSLTLAGIGGIGWVMSPRSAPALEAADSVNRDAT
jgi:hypothetical protein